jgi:long-chain fatty acid transport protein
MAGVALAVILAGLSTAQGAGFALYEMSARGNALGGTLIGFTGDASANYFNPANMTDSEGVSVMAGASFIGPHSKISTSIPTPMGAAQLSTESEDNWWVPPHAYASMQIAEKTWVGVGVYSPFGLGSEFDPNWVGRYNSYKAIIESVDLNPNIAYKLDDNLSVAVGLQVMTFDLQLKRKLPSMAGGPDMDFELKGDSVGYGGNAAVSYKVNKNFGLGLVYRSEVDQSVDGDANLIAGGTKYSTAASGKVTLPASTSFGGNYKLGDLTLGVAVTYTEWSSFDELKIKFANPALLGRSESVTPKDWNNVWRYAAGAEYALNDACSLRCSYVFDEDPIPDESADYLIPSNDRHLFGVGAGCKVGRYTIDLGYTYLLIVDRDNVPGRLAEGVFPSSFEDGFAHILAASVGATF